jgi:hypothetical protein
VQRAAAEAEDAAIVAERRRLVVRERKRRWRQFLPSIGGRVIALHDGNVEWQRVVPDVAADRVDEPVLREAAQVTTRIGHRCAPLPDRTAGGQRPMRCRVGIAIHRPPAEVVQSIPEHHKTTAAAWLGEWRSVCPGVGSYIPDPHARRCWAGVIAFEAPCEPDLTVQNHGRSMRERHGHVLEPPPFACGEVQTLDARRGLRVPSVEATKQIEGTLNDGLGALVAGQVGARELRPSRGILTIVDP